MGRTNMHLGAATPSIFSTGWRHEEASIRLPLMPQLSPAGIDRKGSRTKEVYSINFREEKIEKVCTFVFFDGEYGALYMADVCDTMGLVKKAAPSSTATPNCKRQKLHQENLTVHLN